MGEFNDRSFWKQRCQTEKEVTKEMFSNKVSLHSRFLFLAIRSGLSVEITLCKKSNFFVQKVDFEKNREFWWFFMSKNTHFDSDLQPKIWIFGQNVDF